jgi:hypothetical protein
MKTRKPLPPSPLGSRPLPKIYELPCNDPEHHDVFPGARSVKLASQAKPVFGDPGYYVSVIDGARSRLVAGPFSTHEEALAQVDPQRNHWYELDPKSWFYAWGTARVRQPSDVVDAA